MKQPVTWKLAGLAAVVLLGPGTVSAGVQGREGVYWLGTGDWQLCARNGEAVLVASGWRKSWSGWLPEDRRNEWHVSTPTIKSKDGKFLASDPEGRTPSVRLVKDKGANTRWAFDILADVTPGRGDADETKFKVGASGFRFRVLAAEGPFKNWYMAAEEPQQGQGAATRRLKLVRDVKKATVFTYIEENYYVDHK
jgi:hypothetical protein